ncbi:MAG: glutamate-5-semialdehyde dehydrogenase [Muribaculaceae bacterium]|nr:glutamate-5-semialdehyde dehydrogenase [Muribaculaceae bacterium]
MTDYTPIFKNARKASRSLINVSPKRINRLLLDTADAIEVHTTAILQANERDLARMDEKNPKYDRLRLTTDRLAAIAADMRSVAALPTPLGRTIDEWTRPNGMTIKKVNVPFGVIGVIYEARPNVTFDVFALTLKAGSAVLLKGGSDAHYTNECSAQLLRRCVEQAGIDIDSVQLLPMEHESTGAMLQAVGYVDLIIPRGSKGLIEYVRDNSRVPVIETGAGVCHTYLHASGRTDYAQRMVYNAKTRRPSVCNTLDTLIIDRSRLADLPQVVAPMLEKNVVIYADAEAYAALEGKYPLLEHATADDFGREWLDYKCSVITVDGVDEAIDTIARYGSHHSEAIVAEDAEAIDKFTRQVDAACVYVNVSTAFTDGAQFGFGAEIGISTQKLHARGPMALPEITTYKYIITGHGLTRD